MKERNLRELGRRGLAVLLTLAMCLTSVQIPAYAGEGEGSEAAPKAGYPEKAIDGSTSNQADKMINANGVGYVWTDKTVTESDDHYGFDITYSALGTSEIKETEKHAPVDLVIALDITASLFNKNASYEVTDKADNGETLNDIRYKNKKYKLTFNSEYGNGTDGKVEYAEISGAEAFNNARFVRIKEGRLLEALKAANSLMDWVYTQNEGLASGEEKSTVSVYVYWGSASEALIYKADAGAKFDDTEVYVFGDKSGEYEVMLKYYMGDNTYYYDPGNNETRTWDWGGVKDWGKYDQYALSAGTNIEAGMVATMQQLIDDYESGSSRIPVAVIMSDGYVNHVYEKNANTEQEGMWWDIPTTLSDGTSIKSHIYSGDEYGYRYNGDATSKPYFKSKDTDKDTYSATRIDSYRVKEDDGDTGDRDTYANLKTILTGAYLKAKVAETYGRDLSEVFVYTVGIAAGASENNSALNPAGVPNDSQIRTDFDSLLIGSSNKEYEGLPEEPKKSNESQGDPSGPLSKWFTSKKLSNGNISSTPAAILQPYTNNTSPEINTDQIKFDYPTKFYSVKNDISGMFNDIKNEMEKITTLSTHPVKGVTTYHDEAGDGMHIDTSKDITVTGGCLQTEKVTFSYSDQSRSWELAQGKTTKFTNFYGVTVDVSNIEIDVTDDDTIEIRIPEELLPVKFKNSSEGDNGIFDDQSPIQFTYHVTLDPDEKDDEGYSKSVENKQYKSNDSAYTQFTPSDENKYYLRTAENDGGNETWNTNKNGNNTKLGGGYADEQTYNSISNDSVVTVKHNNNGYFILPKKYGSLTVTKNVVVAEGNGEAPSKEFNFAITLACPGYEGMATVTEPDGHKSSLTFSNGPVKCSLKDDESITISHLPVGTKFTVTENLEGVDSDFSLTKISGPTDNGERKENSWTGEIKDESNVAVTFTNTYTPLKPAHVTVLGRKRLKGAFEFINTESAFNFIVDGTVQNSESIAPNDIPSPVSIEILNGSGEGTFIDAEYAEPGIYVYTITEQNGSDPEIEYDSSEYRVTVTVSEGSDRRLEATVVVVKKSDPEGSEKTIVYAAPKDFVTVAAEMLEFVNTVKINPTPDTLTIDGTKNFINSIDEDTVTIEMVLADKSAVDPTALKEELLVGKIEALRAAGLIKEDKPEGEQPEETINGAPTEENTEISEKPEISTATDNNATKNETGSGETEESENNESANGADTSQNGTQLSVIEIPTINSQALEDSWETSEAGEEQIDTVNAEEPETIEEKQTIAESTGESLAAYKEQTTAAGAEESSSAGEEQTAAASVEESSSTVEERATTAHVEESSAANEEQTTVASAEETSAANEEQTTAANEKEPSESVKEQETTASVEETSETDEEQTTASTAADEEQTTAANENTTEFAEERESEKTDGIEDIKEPILEEEVEITEEELLQAINENVYSLASTAGSEFSVDWTKDESWEQADSEDKIETKPINGIFSFSRKYEYSVDKNVFGYYTYLIREKKNEEKQDVVYDSRIYKVVVCVTANVTEKKVDAKVISTTCVYPDESSGNNVAITFENIYNPKAEITVNKEWLNDFGDANTTRGEVEVKLYRSVGNGEAEAVPVDSLMLTLENGYSGKWSGLDVYVPNQDNVKYTYSVKEMSQIEGYRLGNTEEELKWTAEEDRTGKYSHTFTVKNTYNETPTVTVKVTKHWDDQLNAAEKRGSGVTMRLLQKKAKDDNYSDYNTSLGGMLKINNVEQESFSSTAYLGTVDGTCEWSGLPKYYEYTDPEGKTQYGEYTYSVKETGSPNGYATTIKSNKKENEWTYTITNRKLIDILVEKFWKGYDESNADEANAIPNSITVTLSADSVVELPAPITLKADSAGVWKGEFKNLPKFNDDGELINYSITESCEGLITTDGTGSTDEENWWKGDIKQVEVPPEGYEYKFEITNTFQRYKTEVPVEKKWEDMNNILGMRPSSITVVIHQLKQENEPATEGNKYAELKITPADWKENTWSGRINELPKYYYDSDHKQQAYIYTVTEEPTYDNSEYYTPKIDQGEDGGFVITNTLQVAKLRIAKWIDNYNERLDKNDLLDDEFIVGVTAKINDESVFDSGPVLKHAGDKNGKLDSNKYSGYLLIPIADGEKAEVTVTETAIPKEYSVSGVYLTLAAAAETDPQVYKQPNNMTMEEYRGSIGYRENGGTYNLEAGDYVIVVHNQFSHDDYFHSDDSKPNDFTERSSENPSSDGQTQTNGVSYNNLEAIVSETKQHDEPLDEDVRLI